MAVSPLCARPDCAIPRRHKPGCDQDTCRGCQPAQAAPGLQLCDHHTTYLATDATRCAELEQEIEHVLISTNQRGERTSGTPSGTTLNDRAVEVRSEIRHILRSWARLVADERGIHLPPDTTLAVGAYLVTHHVWLAARPDPGGAGDVSSELDSLRRRAWSTAYPSGQRTFKVGPCMSPNCAGVLYVVLRDSDGVLPSELVCDGQPAHSWTADRWRELDHATSRRYLSVVEIADRWHLPVGTIYRHASEREWRRVTDGRKRALYLAADVRATLDQGANA